MKKINNLERSLENLRLKTSPATDQRILSDASDALAQSSQRYSDSKQTSSRRTIMKKHWPKLAAAAVIIVAVVASITVLQESSTPAYALEQTIQANHSVRTIHIRDFPAGAERPKEFWAEFGDSGELLHCRAEFPQSEDGSKTVIWQDDKAEVWFKAKKLHLIIKDKMAAGKLLREIVELDPKLAVDRLHALQA